MNVRQIRRRLRYGYQMVTRGWADEDCWSLDVVLCRRLGEQLLHLAETVHGWPASNYRTFEEWKEAIRRNGQALIDYVEKPGHTDALMKWHKLKFGDGHDLHKINEPNTPEVEEALQALDDLDQGYYQGAVIALHWVAANLDHLWD